MYVYWQLKFEHNLAKILKHIVEKRYELIMSNFIENYPIS